MQMRMLVSLPFFHRKHDKHFFMHAAISNTLVGTFHEMPIYAERTFSHKAAA